MTKQDTISHTKLTSVSHKHYIDSHMFRQSSTDIQAMYYQMDLQIVTPHDSLLEKLYLPDKANDQEWCVPFWAVRGALFCPVARNQDRDQQVYDEKIPVFTHDTLRRVFASGPRLTAADQKVWMECLYLLQDTTGSQHQPISYRSLCLGVGRTYSTNAVNAIKKSLTRLSQVTIEFLSGKDMKGDPTIADLWSHYFTPMLEYNDQNHTIAIPPVLLLLLTQQHRNNELITGREKKYQIRHIRVNRRKHNQLTTDLGCWLHSWFLSHSVTEPIPFTILQQRTHMHLAQDYNAKMLIKRAIADIKKADCFEDVLLGQKSISIKKYK